MRLLSAHLTIPAAIKFSMIFIILLISVIASAAESAESAESKYEPQTGKVIIGSDLATLDVPEGMLFFAAKDARHLLENVWHNPPDPSVLGLVLMPGDEKDKNSNDTVVVVSYDESGHVSDSDASSMDYQQLLVDMQNEAKDSNPERIRQGYGTVELLGWSEQPHYDSAAKKLYWAKSLLFGDSTEPTLNYCVRILGRKGVLELNAIGDVRELSKITPIAQNVLAKTEFNTGNRYADFDESTDSMAVGGLAALIAGGVVANKLGFFAMIGVFILKFIKILIIPVIAIGVWAARKFGRG